MKQRTRFSGLVAFLCLMATTALAQSYTIRFVKGTDRIDRQDSRTVGNLGELVSRLSDCKHQLEKGRYVVGLTAFQNVVDRYDPAAKSLSLAQAAALQEYLTDVCCLNDSAPFDLSVDARTDLDNRVIVELRKQPTKTDRQSMYRHLRRRSRSCSERKKHRLRLRSGKRRKRWYRQKSRQHLRSPLQTRTVSCWVISDWE
ncbi:MAG: hypothetical protein LUH01_16525 [Parabacteroides gordonii]|nr:hypothetical protein [Parabacteroides gordonii]